MINSVTSFEHSVPIWLQKYLPLCNEQLRDKLLQESQQFGDWEDRDDLTMGLFFQPIMHLLDLGWSSDDILTLDNRNLQIAGGADYSCEEYYEKLKFYNVTDETSEEDAKSLLKFGVNSADKRAMKDFRDWESIKDFIPKWVYQQQKLEAFLSLIRRKSYPKYYLKAISEIDVESFLFLQNMPQPVLLHLCLQDLYKRGVCKAPSVTLQDTDIWLRIVTPDKVELLPIYKWKLVCEYLKRFSTQDVSIDTRGDCITLYIGNFKQGWRTPLKVRNLDDEDPIMALVEKTFELCNTPITNFDDIALYSEVFPLVYEIAKGNRDWVLYLRFPKLYPVLDYFGGGSLHRTLFRAVGKEVIPIHAADSSWFMHEGKMVSVYTSYLTGVLKNKGGDTVETGTNEVSSDMVEYISSVLAKWLSGQN